MSELDLSIVDQIVERHGRGPGAVIPILQAVQEHYRHLPAEALNRVCSITQITPSAITGVSTFYDQFRHKPMGEHLVRVCHGTACHVKGAWQLTEALHRYLHIREDDDTDPDGLFTVQKVACLGCCSLAPAVQIDELVYGHVQPEGVGRMLRDFLETEKQAALHRKSAHVQLAPGEAGEIRICVDSCCVARGCGKVYEALQQAVDETGARVSVKRVGCVSICGETPLLEIHVPGGGPFLYARVQPEDAKAIVLRHFKPQGVGRKVSALASATLDRVLTDEAWEPVTRYSVRARDPQLAGFLDPQEHIATEHTGVFDPLDIDGYIEHGGFEALKRYLNDGSPERVIEQIERSGLRGRGGGGYPTGRKWSQVRGARGEVKYVVCNGDEGDPGAFMDRMLLESCPYRIIEGMAVAAFAVGAEAGYFYIREEYPLAVRRIEQALARCEERGLVGDDVLGSGRSLHLHVMRGAGAFVCGEETALLASIEGRRGMPRLRPPYPAQSGLWGRPTLVNNVETFAAVPWILRNGPDEFSRHGVGHSKGTKVFALAGKVARGGLIEVPMGLTIRQIVEQIGGGIQDGRRFKTVLVGGPSGGCLPAEMADTPIDYEELSDAGAIMGSGGLVVLDDTDCMVDIARYFLEFTQNQSCGKCTPCRVGTRRMLDIIDRLCAGEGHRDDIEVLEDLAEVVKRSSLCALGGTAPNPVLSTLRHFRDEYEAHLEGRCPAGICKALIRYVITDDCIGCTRCAQHCPADAIAMKPYEKHEIDPDKCVRCGTCSSVCPVEAVRVE